MTEMTPPHSLITISRRHAVKMAAAALLAVTMFAALPGCSAPTSSASSTSSSSTSSSASSSSSSTTTSGIGSVEVGDTVMLGTYEQDNNTSNGKEAIEWQVLDVKDGKALLISKYALDSQSYNTKTGSVTWETCAARSWLNSTFYTAAFSTDEQSKIVSTTLTNEDNPDYKTEGGKSTTDKVFCLSLSEVKKYFSTDSSRICSPTAYAVAQKVSINRSTNGCKWYTRTPGYYKAGPAFVKEDGSLYGSSNDIGGVQIAVRPALWVNL